LVENGPELCLYHHYYVTLASLRSAPAEGDLPEPRSRHPTRTRRPRTQTRHPRLKLKRPQSRRSPPSRKKNSFVVGVIPFDGIAEDASDEDAIGQARMHNSPRTSPSPHLRSNVIVAEVLANKEESRRYRSQSSSKSTSKRSFETGQPGPRSGRCPSGLCRAATTIIIASIAASTAPPHMSQSPSLIWTSSHGSALYPSYLPILPP